MIEVSASLVVGQEEDGACPVGRSDEGIDDFGHGALTRGDINGWVGMWVLTGEGIGDHEGDLWQGAGRQVFVVIGCYMTEA